MQTHFNACLARARRRWVAEVLLEGLGDVLLGAGLVVAVGIVTERVLNVPLVTWPHAAMLAGGGAAVLAVLWLLKRPTRAEVAILIDDRIALRERFSTTLAMAASTDPFAAAAREECYARAERVDVSKHFPIRPGRGWAWAAGAWVVAAAAFLAMPTLDLFGHQAEVQRLAAEQKKADAAVAEIKKTASKVETMIKPLDATEVLKDLAALAELKSDMGSADVRREAIRKMGEISDKLQELGGGKDGEAGKMIQTALKQLKSPPSGLSRKLAQSMARGKFGDAAQALKDLEDKIAKSELSQADKDALAKDLESLAQQIKAAADQQKNLADALAAAGADPNLAKLSGDNLKEALKQAGLDAKTIQKLMQNQQACQAAAKALGDLAQTLGQCAGGAPGPGGAPSPEAMQALGDQLNQLEAMRQEMALAKAALDELRTEMAALGQGLGGPGEFAEGPAAGEGGGSGGPGRGSGPRDTSPSEITSKVGSRVANKGQAGPVIATWMSQEEQVKGEVTRDFESNLQAAKDRASEAISENAIPARYHGPVTKYFETVGQPDEPREKP
jgi:hypothetical protein